MASSLFFFDASPPRPIAFTQEWPAPIRERLAENSKLAGVVPASRLEVRPAPEMVSSGVRQLDDLTGGLPRGCLTEICGAASSGRTSVLLGTLAAATQRQESCALVDVSDALDPGSAAAAGVNFERLLWVRCGKQSAPHRHPSTALRAGSNTEKENQRTARPIEQALRILDLLLQGGGFGLVAIDLSDVPYKLARRIPLTSWFRFQRAVEHTPAVLLAITPAPCTQSCAAIVVRMKPSAFSRQLSGEKSAPPAHSQIFEGLQVEGEILRSRVQRKPVRSAVFMTSEVRAG